MGAVNSACGGCFGNTYDMTQTTLMRRKQSRSQTSTKDLDNSSKSDLDELKNTSSLDDEALNQDNPEESKTMTHFSLTSKEFELVKVLVKGSFGKICLVRRKSDDVLFVLKVLKTHDIYAKNLLSSLTGENSLMRDIEHPFILHLEGFYQDNSRAYVLTEFCSRGNLSQKIKKEGKLDLYAAKIFAAELILSIQYIHEVLDTVHKEINPKNILFASDDHIRLSGFGFSKTYVKGITHSGTHNYLAPETSSGLPYGPEADWWSLGCVIYFMLTGQPLFENHRSSDSNGDEIDLPAWFSNSLKDLLNKLLKRNPQERLGSKGAQEIKSHPFFNDIDWDVVLHKDFIPSIKLHVIEEEVTEDQIIFSVEG